MSEQIIKEAIAHTLRRVGTEPEFRWHMLHTETLERLCAAYDAICARTPGETMREVLEQRPRPEIGNCERHRYEASVYVSALQRLHDAAAGTSTDRAVLEEVQKLLDDGPGDPP